MLPPAERRDVLGLLTRYLLLTVATQHPSSYITGTLAWLLPGSKPAGEAIGPPVPGGGDAAGAAAARCRSGLLPDCPGGALWWLLQPGEGVAVAAAAAFSAAAIDILLRSASELLLALGSLSQTDTETLHQQLKGFVVSSFQVRRMRPTALQHCRASECMIVLPGR